MSVVTACSTSETYLSHMDTTIVCSKLLFCWVCRTILSSRYPNLTSDSLPMPVSEIAKTSLLQHSPAIYGLLA